MTKRVLYIVLLPIAWLYFGNTGYAQKYSATKTVNKTFTAPREMLFEIDAEKATINVVQSKGNTILVKVTQTARGNNEQQCNNDLSVLKYTEFTSRERILIRAFISIPQGKSSITSLLNNDITVELPANCHLKIKNRLGDITIAAIGTSISTDIEYGNLTLSDAACRAEITMKRGELSINDCRLDGSIEANNCKIRTKNLTGRIAANTRMGSAIINLPTAGFALNATSDNTDFTIFDKEKKAYNYTISARSGKIDAQEIAGSKLQKSPTKESLQYTSASPKGEIVIKSEFGNIYIY